MAKTIPRKTGSSHKTAITSIVEQIDNDLYDNMKDFHNHSKDCKLCRNPIRAYQDEQDLCTIGCSLSVAITKLLYKKAEHVGEFTVQYPFGWEAVDGLIRIISHYNQGYFSTQIVDLKRTAPAPTPVLAIKEPPRGSQWKEDMRRREQARSSHPNVYGGDARTSYLDTTTTRTQADSSPAGSNRSVHFDSHVQVREFTKP